jgi:flagellum-specific peptidoglycan hydrolase FlgJ
MLKQFVDKYYPFAKITERETGISATFILAQAALESGFGRHAPGYNFFGIKDSDGINGNEQLLTTTEILSHRNAKFPAILWIKEIILKGRKMFQYRVKDYFRKYKSPDEAFAAHANFFFRYKRYAEALKFKSDPYKFAEEIAKAGYATDPLYADKITKLIKSITNELSTRS